MKKRNLENLLLVGLDLVALAKSAKTLGFKVYAADFFGDYDLAKACDAYRAILRQEPEKSCGKIEDQFNPKHFVGLVRELLKEKLLDAMLLSSGLDDSFEVLDELDELVPILGNKPETFRRVRDKHRFFRELERLNLAYPNTAIVESLEDAWKAAKDIGYPVVVKPLSGFAGANIRKAENPKELKEEFKICSKIDGEAIIQKYIEGIHASISFLSSKNGVKILSINEQLLGLRELGQLEPFGFCGNIVPLMVSADIFQKCLELTEKIALHFGLLGSNGIDFVLSKDGIPYVIEVNPRFQATFECVERVLGINLVEAHINACLNNYLPDIRLEDGKHCVRLILYARNRVKAGDLTGLMWVRDVPFPQTIIEKGEPLCSVVVEAERREDALKEAMEKAELIYGKMVKPI